MIKILSKPSNNKVDFSLSPIGGTTLIKIAIGSLNKAKIAAVKSVFVEEEFDFESYEVPSGVSNQPFSDEETIKGAINRAKHVLTISEAQIGIGLEGGVHETEYGLMLCNWGALVTRTNPPIIAGGARLLLPPEVANQLKAGKELGIVMDEYCQKKNVRENEGAIGVFTNGYISRKEMFEHVVRNLRGQYEFYKNH